MTNKYLTTLTWRTLTKMDERNGSLVCVGNGEFLELVVKIWWTP